MELFDEALLEDVRRLPGAQHSFYKQIASPVGAPLRDRLTQTARACSPAVQTRWRELLNALDNKRFFQGFAEAALCERLLKASWKLTELAWPGPVIRASSPSGRSYNLVVLSFVRQIRPRPDRDTLKRLIRSLNRVNARTRIGIHVQRWLPHDFEPEPVRRAVEMWLRDIEQQGGGDRYAVYADEHVSLEFALTDETANEEQSVVAFTVGPLGSQRTLEFVQSRLLNELDLYRLSPIGAEPLLVSCVTQVPWQLSRGWLREMLFGPAAWQSTGGSPPRFEAGYTENAEPSLFRDMLYRSLSGVVFLDRSVVGRDFRAQGYLNPWGRHPLSPAALPFPSLGVVRRSLRETIIGWSTAFPPRPAEMIDMTEETENIPLQGSRSPRNGSG